jgi:hypothetical protein
MATLMCSYTIESGKLIIRRGDDRLAPIIADFKGIPVYKVLPFSSGDGCLVLLDPGFSKAPTFENLLCVKSSGHVEWRAQLPDSHDAFVDVLFVGEAIEGRTWNGYRVEIDPATGKSKKIGFTK